MRRRVKRTKALEQRLAEEAGRLRLQAKFLPAGAGSEKLMRKGSWLRE
jgi:hypothetical protein